MNQKNDLAFSQACEKLAASGCCFPENIKMVREIAVSDIYHPQRQNQHIPTNSSDEISERTPPLLRSDTDPPGGKIDRAWVVAIPQDNVVQAKSLWLANIKFLGMVFLSKIFVGLDPSRNLWSPLFLDCPKEMNQLCTDIRVNGPLPERQSHNPLWLELDNNYVSDVEASQHYVYEVGNVEASQHLRNSRQYQFPYDIIVRSLPVDYVSYPLQHQKKMKLVGDFKPEKWYRVSWKELNILITSDEYASLQFVS